MSLLNVQGARPNSQIVDAGYERFLEGKLQIGTISGFKTEWMPDFLFDFQKALVDWALQKGRAAIFADCGLGKTLIELVWAQNVTRKMNARVLILTPLAVAHQFIREGDKFGIKVDHDREAKRQSRITVSNYERLHYFRPTDFEGVVCDESSILKNFSGKTRKAITEFLRRIPFRLLCTATAAPNDYIEFGTSAEALGELGYMDMLSRFFKQADGVWVKAFQRAEAGNRGINVGGFGKFRFRGHAEKDFWRWICSWARALRKPSDLGFSDGAFELPRLSVSQHVVNARHKADGMLFDLPAYTLAEQRAERRRTVRERCEKVAEIISASNEPVVAWCNLNDEGDLLDELIPGAEQVSGSDSDDKKERLFSDFESGKLQTLVTKPTIAGFGLNWQHCARQTFFPLHSFEQWYQAIRRSWRFGQTRDVNISIITSEGEARVLSNLQRKSEAADIMFRNIVASMNDALGISRLTSFSLREELPQWLS